MKNISLNFNFIILKLLVVTIVMKHWNSEVMLITFEIPDEKINVFD